MIDENEIEETNNMSSTIELFSYKKNILDRIFPDGIFTYRAQYILLRPWKIVEEICDRIKWAWQRVFRGWDDRVVWSIDHYLTEMIPVWLTKLKEDKTGVPVMCFEESDLNDVSGCNNAAMDRAEQKYDNILDQIIEGFQTYQKMEDDCIWKNNPEYEELYKKFENGMKLFTEYFGTFWD